MTWARIMVHLIVPATIAKLFVIPGDTAKNNRIRRIKRMGSGKSEAGQAGKMKWFVIMSIIIARIEPKPVLLFGLFGIGCLKR